MCIYVPGIARVLGSSGLGSHGPENHQTEPRTDTRHETSHKQSLNEH